MPNRKEERIIRLFRMLRIIELKPAYKSVKVLDAIKAASKRVNEYIERKEDQNGI